MWYESSHISFLNVSKKSVSGIFQYGGVVGLWLLLKVGLSFRSLLVSYGSVPIGTVTSGAVDSCYFFSGPLDVGVFGF